jgi:two-component system, cell cycle response regulator
VKRVKPLRAYVIFVALALAAFAGHLQFGLGGSGLDGFFDTGVYNGLILTAAVCCFLRAARGGPERAAWTVMGVGITSWLAGDLYWAFVLSGMDSPPYPSLSDALYLGFYPCCYVALGLLARARLRDIPRSAWLDGAIVGLSVAALATALVFQPIVDASTGGAAAVATNLAYPIGDVTLLSLVVAFFGLSRWRAGRGWLMIGAGMALNAIADAIYLVQVAQETYVEGTILDVLWPLALVLVGLAAWQPHAGAAPRSEDKRAVLMPTLGVVLAILLMTYDHFDQLNTPALVITALTLLAATARMALTFAEHQGMLRRSRTEAMTDALTGLRNRRALMHDLEAEVGAATPTEPRAVLLFDLDGFKQYNDTFGHPAGDAMLARLGGLLGEAMAPYGRSYRLGGDEFCALVRPGSLGVDPLITIAEAALAESGEGFEVSATSGTCLVPSETSDASEALQLADRRMYARKGGGRASITRQTRDVLLRTLREREPELHEHLHGVAELAVQVGQRMNMATEQLDELARAAELHDIGKVAIPDAILNKPGPLNENEWSFLHRHTIVGERILGAAPALRPVARLVRASHEAWDGTGYPDGLAGSEIPLGARIVAVCDAYHAMTTDRPYRSAMTPDEAMAELRRCAGTQFDPAVVDAFERIDRTVDLVADAFSSAASAAAPQVPGRPS